MIEGWHDTELGQLIDLNYGKDHKKLNDGEIPCFGSGGLMRHVDQRLSNDEAILIPRKGSLNNIQYVNSAFWTVDTLFWGRVLQDRVFGKFLFYQLSLLDFTTLNVGSAVPSLTVPIINGIEVNLPPLPEQKAIAGVFSSLDDKIDLLHRQNKTLEALAETLFRQWFIEEADDDWEEVELGDYVATNVDTAGKNDLAGEIRYLDTGSLTEGITASYQPYQFADAPSRARRRVKHNDVLISTVRPNQKHYGLMRFPDDDIIVSTGFCVISAQDISPYFLYTLLTSDKMTEYLHMIAAASTSAYPSLKPIDIEKLTFNMPPESKLLKFHDISDEHWKKIENNHRQIQTLEKLRDTLLPKLMSGEVRVQFDAAA